MLSANSRAFLAVVDTGSFTRAAETMGLSTSQISRRVSKLEEELQTSLLRRTTRQVGLTEAGEHYYESLQVARNELRDAQIMLRSAQEEPSGLLRVTSTTFLGHRLVQPIVADLLQDFPDLDVQLIFTSQPLELVEEGIDVAVRVEPFANPSTIGRKLMSTTLVLVASPEYLAERGAPETLGDMQEHRFIMWDAFRRRQSTFSECISVGGERVDWEFESRLIVSNLSTMMRVLLAGMGIGVAPLPLINDELEEGTLVRVLAGHTAFETYVIANYLERHYLLPSVRIFIDRLVEHAATLG